MKQAAINYAKALFETGIAQSIVKQAEEIYSQSPQLPMILESPVVDYEKKTRTIERIFPSEIWNFLKLVCYNRKAAYLKDIFQVYESLKKEEQSILTATLFYVTKPEDTYIEQMKEFLRRNYQRAKVELSLVQDSSLMGGFLLQVGNQQYDNSVRGALQQLQQKFM